jgi:hypothetical protein
MQDFKIFKKTLICISLLLLLVFIQSPESIQASHNSSLKVNNIQVTTEDPYSDWWESAWVWVDSFGWINSRAEVQSRDLGFGSQNLNLFIASYPSVYEVFDHANWWFHRSNDPYDRNGNIEIQFRTTDGELAKNYADLIVQFMGSKLAGFNYEYEGTYAWEDWRGDHWQDLTQVHYSARIDWPWFTGFINNEVIPRNIGGLAETINVTDADNIHARAWPSGDSSNPQVTFGLGVSFHYDIYSDLGGSYFGSHTLDIKELIHATKIQKSPYQGGNLWINYALPNVTNIAHDPIANNSQTQIYTRYHPPLEEWTEHHYYDIDFEIGIGPETNASVSFDYDFIPWFARTRTECSLITNQYGYEYKGINLRGPFASLLDVQSLPNWDNNLTAVNLAFNPLRGDLWNSFEVELMYPDYDNHSVAANLLAMDISNQLGITYTNNDTDHWDWWDHNAHYEGRRYRFHSDDFNLSMSLNLLTPSDVIASTPVFENQNLTSLVRYNQWTVYRPEISQWINDMDFEWNPLREEITDPIKKYVGAQTDIKVDLLTEWGWPTFPYSTNYSLSEFRIIVPDNQFSVYPFENNGYGWHIDIWHDHWYNMPTEEFVTARLEIYTEAASLKFNNGSSFTSFGVEFDYSFYADNEDLMNPGTQVYYVDDSGEEYHDYWSISNNFVFQGVDEHLKVHTWDDNSQGIDRWWMDFYYVEWNSTSSSWDSIPRFGTTGIQEVNVKAHFTNLPIHDPQFERELTLINTGSGDYHKDYNISWNTLDGFADGYWGISVDAMDGNGNHGGGDYLKVLVDNYDDTIYTTVPTIDVLTAQNDLVAGIHTIRVNITDDIDVFASVLTRDNLGWVLEDSDGDSIYEFSWDTLGEMEGSIHYFTITAWDMDGHKTIYDFWLEVDNIPTGNPPTITFVTPSTSNETLTGEVNIKVKVQDDHGISSVKMQIDQGASLTMEYDSTLDEYYYNYNVSTLTNGYHMLYVTVIDIDENQHTVTQSIDFTVVGGQEGPIVSNPPEWNETLSSLPENLTKYVEEERFLEYTPEKGSIYFKIAAKDDRGIAEVTFTAYTISNFDPTTGLPDESDLSQTFATTMTSIGTDGDWELYEHSWDSVAQIDNYYLVKIDIQDTDEIANHLIISLVLELDNHEDKDTPNLTPGFEASIQFFGLISIVIVLNYTRKYRKNI